MSIQEDIEKVENKMKELESKSFAKELLDDYKKANKRLFIIILVILTMWFATIGYLVYILNDIGTVEDNDTIDIQDVENIDNSHIKIGDDIWEKSQ